MSTTLKVRPARRQDADQMLQVYQSFTGQFVGSAARTVKSFHRLLTGKNNVNLVAHDNQGHITGYILARLEKQANRGEFREIAVCAEHDFMKVARPLVETVRSVFIEKKVAALQAASIRNPWFEKLFPEYGFFESENVGVFMYAVLDAAKLLNDLSPVFLKRLKEVKNWVGSVQMECEGHWILLSKTEKGTERINYADGLIDIRVELNTKILTKLIFGVAEIQESIRKGELEVKSSVDETTTNQVLGHLFPQRQFLIMDYW